MAKTFEFTAPDGKTYEVQGPDDATEEQAFQMLQAQLGSGGGAPAAGPGPGAASPALPGPVSPGAGMGAATPTPGGAPGAGEAELPAYDPSAPSDPRIIAQYEALQQQRADWDAMPALKRFMTGVGESVYSTGKGIQQLYNRAVGDDKRLAELQQEEADRRRLNTPIEESGLGQAGQLAGFAAQAYVPGGALTKGAKFLTAGAPRAAQIGTQLAAEGALGAAQGGMQPTAPGESAMDNAERGAAFGAAGRAVPGVVGSAASFIGNKSGVAPTMAAVTRLLRGSGRQAEESTARRAAGREMGQIMAGTTVPLGGLSKDLGKIGRRYQRDLPASVLDQIDMLRQMPAGAKLKGEAVAEMRTALNREAQDSTGIRRTGLESLARKIDDHVDNSLSKAKVRALRQARDTYRTGRAQPGLGRFTPAAIGVSSMMRDDVED